MWHLPDHEPRLSVLEKDGSYSPGHKRSVRAALRKDGAETMQSQIIHSEVHPNPSSALPNGVHEPETLTDIYSSSVMTRTQHRKMDHHPPGVVHPTDKTETAGLVFTPRSPAAQRPCLASTPDKTLSSPPEPAEGHKGGVTPEVSGCSSAPAPTAFSHNQNHMVCLPLVSNDLKLLWARSEQTQELEGTEKLVEAFNVFPYPTLTETVTLAHKCSLPLDQVRVWFMVRRLRFGISWDCKEISEVRSKFAIGGGGEGKGGRKGGGGGGEGKGGRKGGGGGGEGKGGRKGGGGGGEGKGGRKGGGGGGEGKGGRKGGGGGGEGKGGRKGGGGEGKDAGGGASCPQEGGCQQ